VIPAAIIDAVDTRAAEIADYQGWTYADRIDTRGDYRRLRATLVFVENAPATECDRDGTHCHPVDLEFTWKIEAVTERCSPGVYATSTPYDAETCPGAVSAMSWTWPAARRWVR
jgi:hypothetical protein